MSTLQNATNLFDTIKNIILNVFEEYIINYKFNIVIYTGIQNAF